MEYHLRDSTEVGGSTSKVAHTKSWMSAENFCWTVTHGFQFLSTWLFELLYIMVAKGYYYKIQKVDSKFPELHFCCIILFKQVTEASPELWGGEWTPHWSEGRLWGGDFGAKAWRMIRYQQGEELWEGLPSKRNSKCKDCEEELVWLEGWCDWRSLVPDAVGKIDSNHMAWAIKCNEKPLKDFKQEWHNLI